MIYLLKEVHKMFEKITNKVKKEVEVDEVVGEKFICDECGKEYAKNLASRKVEGRLVYYDVTLGHHDWGNDSCDSIKNKQYCCADCLRKAFNKWVEENEDSETAYFEIQKETYLL